MSSIKKRFEKKENILKMIEKKLPGTAKLRGAAKPIFEAQGLAQDILQEALKFEEEMRQRGGRSVLRLTEYGKLKRLVDSCKATFIEPARKALLKEYERAMESDSEKEATNHVIAMMNQLKKLEENRDYWEAKARLRGFKEP